MEDSSNRTKNSDEKLHVCFISTIPPQARAYLIQNLKSLNNVEMIFREDKTQADLMKLVPNADILIGWRPTRDILIKAEKLKVFINPGAGVKHLIDLFRAVNKKRKVILINGHGNSYFVAQHTIALLLTLMNKTILHHEWMQQGKWRTGDEDAASIPLRGRKVGLFGYGAINQKVHRFLSGFDIEFSILRKHWEKQEEELPTPVKKYEFPQLHDFLTYIDTLIIAVPLTSMTQNVITKKELELLGPEGLILNVSRGSIINEKNLFYALKEKLIKGAAIDVWYNYTPQSDENGRKYPFNFPFHTLNNIILSPHRGYSPFNDVLRWNEVIENITRIAQGRVDYINMVNLAEEY